MKRGSRHAKEEKASSSDVHHAADRHRQAELDEGLNAIYGEERDDLHVVSRGASRLTRWLTRIVITLAVLTPLVFGGYFAYLRWWNPATTEDPLTMELQAPLEVMSGDRVSMSVAYRNTLSVPLASLVIDVNLPPAFIIESIDPAPTNAEEMEFDLGTMPAKSDGKISITGVWVAEAPSATSLQALAEYRPGNFNSLFHDIVTESVTTLGSLLTVDLVAPEQALPGENVELAMRVRNTSSASFEGGQVQLQFPEGFFITSSNPELEAGGEAVWTLGDMPPGFEQEIVVEGSFASDVEGVQAIEGEVGILDGDRFLAQSSAESFVDVIGSDVVLDLIVNGSIDDLAVDPGDQLRVSLRVRNDGESDMQGVSAILDLQADGRLPFVWSDAALGGGRITAEGIVFDAAAIGTISPGAYAVFTVVLPLRESAEGYADSIAMHYRATQGNVTVQANPVHVLVNTDTVFQAEARYYSEDGLPLGNGPLPPRVGDTTSYRMIWKLFNGTHPLEDVVVSAVLPEGVHWEGFAAADSGSIKFDATSRVVSWTIAELPDNVAQTEAYFSVAYTPTEEDVGSVPELLGQTSFRAIDGVTQGALTRSADALTTDLTADGLATGKSTVVAQ